MGVISCLYFLNRLNDFLCGFTFPEFCLQRIIEGSQIFRRELGGGVFKSAYLGGIVCQVELFAHGNESIL